MLHSKNTNSRSLQTVTTTPHLLLLQQSASNSSMLVSNQELVKREDIDSLVNGWLLDMTKGKDLKVSSSSIPADFVPRPEGVGLGSEVTSFVVASSKADRVVKKGLLMDAKRNSQGSLPRRSSVEEQKAVDGDEDGEFKRSQLANESKGKAKVKKKSIPMPIGQLCNIQQQHGQVEATTSCTDGGSSSGGGTTDGSNATASKKKRRKKRSNVLAQSPSTTNETNNTITNTDVSDPPITNTNTNTDVSDTTVTNSKTIATSDITTTIAIPPITTSSALNFTTPTSTPTVTPTTSSTNHTSSISHISSLPSPPPQAVETDNINMNEKENLKNNTLKDKQLNMNPISTLISTDMSSTNTNTHSDLPDEQEGLLQEESNSKSKLIGMSSPNRKRAKRKSSSDSLLLKKIYGNAKIQTKKRRRK